MTFIAKRGTLRGPRLAGELLPGGGDWLLVDDGGVAHVDVRATIRTDDGVLIHYTATGVIQVPADGLERLASGERIPWSDCYIRMTPRFETSDERYSWLNSVVAVAHNELSPDHVDYRIYAVL